MASDTSSEYSRVASQNGDSFHSRVLASTRYSRVDVPLLATGTVAIDSVIVNNEDNPNLPGYFHPNALFRSMRPDIVLIKNDDIYIIELTCCFETNTKKIRRYKMEKCKDIENDCNRQFKNFQKIFIEITSLGLITHNIKEIYRLFHS